jgi:hypothetical protein
VLCLRHGTLPCSLPRLADAQCRAALALFLHLCPLFLLRVMTYAG